jgi:hypothetical protein
MNMNININININLCTGWVLLIMKTGVSEKNSDV